MARWVIATILVWFRNIFCDLVASFFKCVLFMLLECCTMICLRPLQKVSSVMTYIKQTMSNSPCMRFLKVLTPLLDSLKSSFGVSGYKKVPSDDVELGCIGREEESQRFRKHISDLQEEVQTLKNEKADHQRKSSKKEQEIKTLHSEVESRSKEVQEYRKQHQEITSQLKRQLDCEKIISIKEEEIMKFRLEVDKLTQQLGQDMNRRLAADETALENINKKNRPTKIVDEYIELMSNQWLGAKDKLDEFFPEDSNEEFKLKFLCHILMEAETLARHTLKDYNIILQQALQDPITAVSKNRSTDSTELGGDTEAAKDLDVKSLGDDLEDLLATFIKDNSDTANAHRLAQALVQNLQASGCEWRDVMTKLKDNQDLMAYIKEACVLCWKMVTQRPPMTFDLTDIGRTTSKDRHDLYYNCCHDKTAVISSYISPALYQGEKQLVKGKVFTIPQAEWEQKLSAP